MDDILDDVSDDISDDISVDHPHHRSSSVASVLAALTSTSDWSYRRLAAELGCDHTYLNNIAKGRQKPPRDAAFYERVARVAGIPGAEILEWRRSYLLGLIEDDAEVDSVFDTVFTSGEASLAASEAAQGLHLDEDSYLVTLDGAPLDLTFMEFELLRNMVTNPMRVFTREVLLSRVWGYDYFGGTRTVDVHIRRIRMKLGPRYSQRIETVRNVGYRYDPDGA